MTNVGDTQLGKTRLLAEPCATCITRPAGTRIALDNARVTEFIQSTVDAGSYVVCHSTLPAVASTGVEPAVCRGFYDRYRTQTLTLIERLWGFVEVPAPTPGRRVSCCRCARPLVRLDGRWVDRDHYGWCRPSGLIAHSPVPVSVPRPRPAGQSW